MAAFVSVVSGSELLRGLGLVLAVADFLSQSESDLMACEEARIMIMGAMRMHWSLEATTSAVKRYVFHGSG